MLLEECNRERLARQYPGSADNRDYWERLGATRGFTSGHGLLEAPASREFLDELRHGLQRDYLAALERNNGAEAARAAMGQYDLVVSPNLAFWSFQSQL